MKFYIGTGFKNVDFMNEVASQLKQLGFEHTYNWTQEAIGEETTDDLIRFANLEKQAIADSDIVIILLPAGRGTHIELGMALALHKKIYLYSKDGEDFKDKNAVNFYCLKEINRFVGNPSEMIKEIAKLKKEKSIFNKK